MSEHWSPLAEEYDPIRTGSIDGTDTQPHDKALIRALNSNYKINKSLKSDPKCCLFVAKLDFKTTEETLRKHFSKYGTIVSVVLVRDIVTGLSKGYGFVEYKHKSIAKHVYNRDYNQLIDGKSVLIDYEFGRNLKHWKPRRLGAGFGGNKNSGQLRFGCRDRPWKRPISLCKQTIHSNDNQLKTNPILRRVERNDRKSD